MFFYNADIYNTPHVSVYSDIRRSDYSVDISVSHSIAFVPTALYMIFHRALTLLDPKRSLIPVPFTCHFLEWRVIQNRKSLVHELYIIWLYKYNKNL